MADDDMYQVTKPQYVFSSLLQNEILLDVALRLNDGASDDLIHLARVHRRFRSIAQEALVRTGRVRINSIPRYIELLEEGSDQGVSGWAAHIKHVQIKDLVSNYKAFTPSDRAKKACASLVDGLELEVLEDQRHSELKVDLLLSEHWVLVLLAILPNATMLTIRSNDGLVDARFAPLMISHDFAPSTSKSVRKELLSIIESRLKTINITMDKVPTRRPKIAFSLSHFKALKDCTIAGGLISGFHFQPPAAILPEQLETLRILCDKDTCPWDWMDLLQQQMRRSRFEDLRSIQLFVAMSSRSFAQAMVSGSTPSETGSTGLQRRFAAYRRDKRVVLTVWERMDVDFETHFAEDTSCRGDVEFNSADYTEVNLLQVLQTLDEE